MAAYRCFTEPLREPTRGCPAVDSLSTAFTLILCRCYPGTDERGNRLVVIPKIA
jgi:hypothetical protein